MVYVFGKDENGSDFERVIVKKIIPQTIVVSALSGGDLPLDTNTTYIFRIANAGKDSSFRIAATDDRGYIVYTSLGLVDIKSGEYADIEVVLNPGKNNEAIGTKDVVKLTATPSGGFEVYAEAEGTVVRKRGAIFAGSLITTGATVNDNGEVYIWGFRGSGQQGNGKLTVSSSAKPAKVESLANIVQLTGGAYHLIALDANGDVWGWGQSGYGETGCKPNTGIYVTTPCKVLSDIVQVAAGEYFTIALSNDGKVYTFGHNLYGQLGNGASKNSQTPVLVDLNGEKARLVGGAYEGAFAVTTEGHLWAWGDNEASGLGFKGTNYGVQKIIRTPTRIESLDQYASQIVYIAGGNGWGEALLGDGRVVGWGLQASLGRGTTKTSLSSPDPVVILDNVKSLFARYVGSIALSNDGIVYTWGQTGGSAFKTIYGETPAPHNVTGTVAEIGGGKEHIFYKTEEGDLFGVGYNDLYKLNLNKAGTTIDWTGSKIGF
ncbi:MAG: hypothetical protein LBI57_01910 [Helicobacteraceae bacterium]|nr:hypothetical protein [Helicobacteraceae bacterium]